MNGGTLQTNAGNTPTGVIGTSNSIVVNSGGVISVGDSNSFVGGLNLGSKTTIQINAGGAIVNNGSSTNHLVALVLNGGTLSAAAGANATYANWNFDLGVSTPGSGSTSTMSGGTRRSTRSAGQSSTSVQAMRLNVSCVLAHVTSIWVPDTRADKERRGQTRPTDANTYTSPTTINQGEMVVDGWLTTSAVSVNGGTLGGTGYLAVLRSTLAVTWLRATSTAVLSPSPATWTLKVASWISPVRAIPLPACRSRAT